MKVVEKNNKKVRMSEIGVGECFIFYGELCIRLVNHEKYMEYVVLCNGDRGARDERLDYSYVDCVPVDAEVTWSYKD